MLRRDFSGQIHIYYTPIEFKFGYVEGKNWKEGQGAAKHTAN